MTKLTLIIRDEEKDKETKFKFESLEDGNTIYESRASDIANILSYDRDHYGDLNIETLIRAAELANLIKKG